MQARTLRRGIVAYFILSLGFTLTRLLALSHVVNLPFGFGEWASSNSQGYTSAEYVQTTLLLFFILGLFGLRELDKRQRLESRQVARTN